MSETVVKSIKPLGKRAYGSIPHLPGSRRGKGDYGLDEHQAAILTTKCRDKHDIVIVQEKLDGSCVSVAKQSGKIIALMRAGYLARDSQYTQHHHFADWVEVHHKRFDELLKDGERVCGEWLMEAHGTLYRLGEREPFVAFDLIRGNERITYTEFCNRVPLQFETPKLIHIGIGEPCSISKAMTELGDFGYYGAIDPAEGCVWRVERNGKVDFLGKYVRPEKVDGKYLENISGKEAVYNWKPHQYPHPLS